MDADAAAVASATRAAVLAGLPDRARFLAAEAAAGLPEAVAALGGLDVLVVDPPRRGLGPATRAALIAAAAPRVVYVSCAPATLAADLADLAAAGYSVVSVEAIDMMPGTPHIEAVAVLERSRAAATRVDSIAGAGA